MKRYYHRLSTLLLVIVSLTLIGCSEIDERIQTESSVQTNQEKGDPINEIDKEEYYYDVEEVAAYIHLYDELPNNYISKQEADHMGWTPDDEVYVIGGDRFGNREGLLPKSEGRQYYEADVQAGYTHHRGPERIVFSDDGLIYYTADHYDSFEQLY